MALVISLEGLTVEKEKTELSTEVIDNWEYVREISPGISYVWEIPGDGETVSASPPDPVG